MLDKKYFMLPLKVRIVLIIFNVSPIPVFYKFFFFPSVVNILKYLL